MRLNAGHVNAPLGYVVLMYEYKRTTLFEPYESKFTYIKCMYRGNNGTYFFSHTCIKTNLKQKCIFLINVMDGWTDGIFYPDIM